MDYLFNYPLFNPYTDMAPNEYYAMCNEHGLKYYSTEANDMWTFICMSEEAANNYGPSMNPEDYAPVHGPVQLTCKQKEAQWKEGDDLPF